MISKILYWVLVPLLLLGCSHQTAPSESKSATAKPSTPASELPTDGIVKDGVYTNRFFLFSIQFPQAWKVLNAGVPMTQGRKAGGMAPGPVPAGNLVEAGYSLLMAGTVNNQTQSAHGVTINAFKVASSAPNLTPDKFLKAEAAASKAELAEYQKKGETPPVAVGEPTEVQVSGRRLTRLDETWTSGRTGFNKPHRLVKMMMADRGYLIMFMFTDPAGDESSHEAAKAMESLRFFAR
jgi:hypothetical protein